MPDHITTYSGTHFFPVSPEADKVHIEDIAHALSLICRGNGQVQTFFSVGQHCINCALEAEARGYSKRMALACLLHDASESYMSDVPRPFKKYLKEYIQLENQLLDVIYTKYLGSPLTPEEEQILKQIDDDMLYFDMRELLREPTNEPEPEMKIKISHKVRPFEEVEQQYLELFSRFSEK